MSYGYLVAIVVGAVGVISVAHGWMLDRKVRKQEIVSNDDVFAPVVPIIAGLVLFALAVVVAVVTFIANGMGGL